MPKALQIAMIINGGKINSSSLYKELKADFAGDRQGYTGLDVNTNISFLRGYPKVLTADLATLRSCTISQRHKSYIPGVVMAMDYVLHSADGTDTGLIELDTGVRPNPHDGLCIVLARINTPCPLKEAFVMIACS
jgi:hypothetical protein